MAITPPHLTSNQYSVLKENKLDSTGTKQAKAFLRNNGCRITPLHKSTITISSYAVGTTRRALAFFSPRKSTNAIYRWKVDVLEGDTTVSKRLIGKSSSVRKRLNGYFTAIRQGQGALAKTILRSVKEQCKKLGLTVSFGVVHSNVEEQLLGRVEDLIIKVHKQNRPEHLLNQRAGGGGASKRKPLSERDVQLVNKVATNLFKNLPKPVPLNKIPHSLRYKAGVVYDIANKSNGKHYVGKTVGFLKNRLSQHLSAVKTQKRAKKLHRDIRKAPDNFCIRVLYQAPANQRHILEEIEYLYIKALDSHKSGYNQNSGTSLLSTRY